MRRIAFILPLTLLMSCTQLPDIAEPVPPAGAEPDYPALVSLDDLSTEDPVEQEAALRRENADAARVANLKARANRLRGFEFD